MSVVGEGGYGRVFKVQNLIDRQVYALKVIELEAAEVSSAVQEVQCLARLHSAKIVRYYTSWLEESKPLSLFIQMEFVHGVLLSSYLQRRQTVDLPSTVELILQVAEALVEIHRAGIVHRDFCPSNIIMRDEGGICVIDFGISSAHSRALPAVPEMPPRAGSADVRPLDQLCIEAAERPVTLKAVGTPMYSSPGQLSGQRSGPADDIYSFGITIFEMLSTFRTNMEKAKAVTELRAGRTLPPEFQARLPNAGRLILQMTDPKHKLRPTAQAVLECDFLRTC
jgi:serine/threonine protein kinase